MIQRHMYYGYIDEEKVRLNFGSEAEHVFLSEYNGIAFMYFETNDKKINPDKFTISGIRELNGVKWHTMPEIFHYSYPLGTEHWKRKLKDKQPYMKVGILHKEMVAKYIYYHYILQESKPAIGDKYGAIFLCNNMIVFYHESPAEKETENFNGEMIDMDNDELLKRLGELPYCEKHFELIEKLDFISD